MASFISDDLKVPMEFAPPTTKSTLFDFVQEKMGEEGVFIPKTAEASATKPQPSGGYSRGGRSRGNARAGQRGERAGPRVSYSSMLFSKLFFQLFIKKWFCKRFLKFLKKIEIDKFTLPRGTV